MDRRSFLNLFALSAIPSIPEIKPLSDNDERKPFFRWLEDFGIDLLFREYVSRYECRLSIPVVYHDDIDLPQICPAGFGKTKYNAYQNLYSLILKLNRDDSQELCLLIRIPCDVPDCSIGSESEFESYLNARKSWS